MYKSAIVEHRMGANLCFKEAFARGSFLLPSAEGRFAKQRGDLVAKTQAGRTDKKKPDRTRTVQTFS
jgi:hypothetical protein